MRARGREKIVRAALRLFAEKGYHNTSIDQVAEKAKISKGNAYHYFESKEDLLKAVVINGLSEFDTMMQVVESKASPEEKLETLINTSFDMFRMDMKFWKLYFSLVTQMNLPKSIKKLLAPLLESYFVYVENLLTQMGVKDAAFESKIIGAMMDGLFLHYIMIGEGYPLAEMQSRIIKKYIKDRK